MPIVTRLDWIILNPHLVILKSLTSPFLKTSQSHIRGNKGKWNLEFFGLY